MLGVSVGVCTHTGNVRSVNEDSIFAGDFVWAVADGMGGHAAGDVASRIVVSHLHRIDHPGLGQESLIEALRQANAEIVGRGHLIPEASGMGSTIAGVARVFIGEAEHWAVFNVGDSRVYRTWGAATTRATVDHSEVEEMVLQGFITEDEARRHPSRSIITRSIGTVPPPQVDIWVLPQTPGECFLICSDGLTSEITDEQISEVLREYVAPEQAARELVDRAVRAGGRDNVSVIVLQVATPAAVDLDLDATNPRSTLLTNG